MMIKIYPLECLDTLILETFNYNNLNSKPISEVDLILVSDNILKEAIKVKFQLKKEIFCLRKKSQIQVLVRKYHSTFIFLLDNVIENQKNKIFTDTNLSLIIEEIIKSLEDLLSYVESRFSIYLSLDQRVPMKYFLVSKKELVLKLDKLRSKKIVGVSDNTVIKLIMEMLYNAAKVNKGNKSTYRHILYQKELLKSLESIDYSEETFRIFSSLDRILIGLNFNYSEYINCLIERFETSLNSIEILGDRNNALLFYFKELSQLQSSKNIMFEPIRQNIKDVLTNWFKHEIAYSEKKSELSTTSKEVSPVQSIDLSLTDQNKLECILSTDQMGLILRATDESRIVKARSMTQVFKTIVPYLSTPFKKDLSYQSVRSKSYHAEERDKLIAIQTLEKIIKKIKTY